MKQGQENEEVPLDLKEELAELEKSEQDLGNYNTLNQTGKVENKNLTKLHEGEFVPRSSFQTIDNNNLLEELNTFGVDMETQNVSTADKMASTQDMKNVQPLVFNERPSAPEPILAKPLKEFAPRESNFKQHRDDKDIQD